MKFVSTLSLKFQYRSVHQLLYQLSVVCGHAKVNLCIDLGLPVRAVHRVCTRLRYFLHRLFTSAQLLNIPSCRGYCEATVKARFLCYKKRYVRCNILHFIPATENVIEKNITDWVVGCTLEFPPLLECLKGVTTTAIELFLTLNILNALPLS